MQGETFGSIDLFQFSAYKSMLESYKHLPHSFLVNYVEERPWWPIHIPNKGQNRKFNSFEKRAIRKSLLTLD